MKIGRGMTDSNKDKAGGRVALRVEVAGRTLGHIRRDLAVVGHSLDAILDPATRAIPSAGRDGWLFRSLPRDRLTDLTARLEGWLVSVRQSYPRHYVPMEGQDFDDWWRGFSSRTRSTLSRKARRLAEHFADRVQTAPSPFRGSFDIDLTWTSRTHHSPMHIWLREQIAQACQRTERPAAP